MENNSQNKKSISFFKLIKNNLLLMILIIVLFGLVGTLLGVMYAKPVYKARRSVILRTELQSSSSGVEGEANNATYAFMMIGQLQYHFTSYDYIKLANEKYQEVNPEAKDKISAGNIVVEHQEDILIFTLAYQDLNKEKAIEKLKAVFAVAEEYFSTHSTAGNIRLIQTDNADIDDSRFVVSVSNNMSMYIIFGVLAGIVVAILAAFIKNALDNTVHDREELEELTGSNILAYIEKR